MTKKEFHEWLELNGANQEKWKGDESFRLSGYGLLYYSGDQNGKYVTVGQNGVFEFGEFNGADYHISEALFTPEWSTQLKDYATAMKAARIMCGNEFWDRVKTSEIGEYEGLESKKSTTEPIRMNFYCPLTIKIDDPEENEFEYAEADNSYLAYHEDKFRDFLEDDLKRGGGEDLAEYFHGSPELQKKLTSVKFDVENVNGVIYGCIHCETTEPVTAEEIEELRNYCTGQASDGFGEGLEQQPFKTPDGDLYVSYWDSDKDWFMLDDDEFWSQIESDQQMGGMQ